MSINEDRHQEQLTPGNKAEPNDSTHLTSQTCTADQSDLNQQMSEAPQPQSVSDENHEYATTTNDSDHNAPDTPHHYDIMPRRSTRIRKPPQYLEDYVLEWKFHYAISEEKKERSRHSDT